MQAQINGDDSERVTVVGRLIDAAPTLGSTAGVREPVSLDEILAAPGPEAGGIPGLTEDEATAFDNALRA